MFQDELKLLLCKFVLAVATSVSKRNLRLSHSFAVVNCEQIIVL